MSAKLESQVIYLKPTRGWSALNLRDLWQYRELVYFLVWRDVKVRYKQAALGILWAVIQPVVNMIIFTFIFGNLAGLPREGTNYELLTLTALLPWHLFSSALSRSSVSLVGNANLLTKVYFPRLAIPFAAVMAGLVDFLIGLGVLGALLLWFQVPLGWNILWLPVFTLLTLLTALAVSLWFSALNVQYRDVQHIVPFLVQVWMYVSPVAYSAQVITNPTLKVIYNLNPMAGIIQGFRWAVLGSRPPDYYLFISIAMVVVLLIGGLFYFRKMEKTFADVV